MQAVTFLRLLVAIAVISLGSANRAGADPPSATEEPRAEQAERPEAEAPEEPQPESTDKGDMKQEEAEPEPQREEPQESEENAKPQNEEPQNEEPQSEEPKDQESPREEPKEEQPADPKPEPAEGDKAEDKTESKADKPPAEESAKEEAPPEPRVVEWDNEVEKVLAKSVPKTAKDLRLIQTQLQRVVAAATPATVSVRVGNAFGSGVIVSADGVVLTAGHVVGKPNMDVTFIFPDGRTAKGKTLGMNQQIDSGMMKITDAGPWPFVKVAKSKEIKGGEWVVAIGQPGGFDGQRTPPVRLGRVLFANDSVINTDCTLVGGDSGGPLFNMRGEVVGIHSRIGRRITNNFHVPISTYHDTWDRLAAAESWGSRLTGKEPVRSWPMLGVASKRKADRCELSQVYPGRPAAVAGLKPGDVITKFAGKPVGSAEQLGKLLYEQKPLSTVKVEVLRGEENLEIKVRLGMTTRPIPGSFDPSGADKKAS